MNWEAIGAIGEVIGAVGVIATLGYLAVQIRQNTSSVRASTLQDMNEASAGFLDLMASDEDLGRIFVSGGSDLETLSAEERPRFNFTMLAFLRRIESFERQTRLNRIHSDEWAGLRASCASIMSRRGSRAWWSENAERFNPGFVEWLNDELGERAV